MDPKGVTGEPPSPGVCYRFGGIVVDTAAHTLLRDGQPQAIEPKAFAVLLVLLQHADELVGRDQLLDTVWGHRHVTPGVLTRAIAQLRAALDDHPHEPRFIQTRHALGYRFIGELEGPAAETGPGDGLAPVVPEPPVVVPAALPPVAQPIATRPAENDDRRPAGRVRSRWRLGSPRTWFIATLALAVALLALAWVDRRAAPAGPAEASIAVLPFTSLSDNTDDRHFAEGLAVEMHDALAGIPGLQVASAGSRPTDGPPGSPDLKALGRKLGVATVLDASVRREGSRLRVNARLSDTATGFTLWSESYDREANDVFAVQREIASEVVHALPGVLPPTPGVLARLAPTRDLGAYEAYLKGQRQLRSPGEDGYLDKAIGFFGQALAADAGFARAQAGICRAEIIRFEGARDAPAFERAQDACRQAAGMDPHLREVSLALGEMHRARGEYAQANEQYTLALDDLGLRPSAYVGLARVQSEQGNNELALEYFDLARQLRPGDALVYRELGYHQYLNGSPADAIESFRTATSLQPDDPTLWSSLGGLYLVEGDNVRAADAFQRSLAIKPSYEALSNLGTLRYAQGAYADAAGLYRRAAALDPTDYRIWGNIGDALAADPATTVQAREPYARAAQMVRDYLAVKSEDAQAQALLGFYLANLGDAGGARERIARAEALATERGEVAFLAAQALALLGDKAGARQRLATARDEKVAAERIQTAPALRSLLDSPVGTQALGEAP
ncbi:winged helix-turn-helix domain-containing protein [Lysobacter sp. F60174L2]|uniref:winged helix-turn-helix domain-containing protein n=1 Tax=Lysobacter sp. F60174L2 TaxID=3459295 RepID=UPI00403E1E62